MHVVGERVGLCERREIGHIALLHVVKTHGDRTFVGGLPVKWLGPWITIAAGANRDFHPGKEIVKAAAGILFCSVLHIAVKLLPHLVVAVDRAARIVIVGNVRSELVRPVREVEHIMKARVDHAPWQTGSSGGEMNVVFGEQARFGKLSRGYGLEGRGKLVARIRRGTLGIGWGIVLEQTVVAAGTELEISTIEGLPLGGNGVIWSGGSVGVDDSLGEQIIDGLSGRGLVGGEKVIEGTILADDHNDVLNGGGGGMFAGFGSQAWGIYDVHDGREQSRT